MRRPALLAGAVLTMLVIASGTTAIGDNSSGFKTGQPSMLAAVMAGVEITPLLTVGDVLPSGFRFEAIPDGISVRNRGAGRVDLFVNHETSKVPFPYVTAAPTAANGENDFDNAQVSRLILNQQSAGVLNGLFVIPSSDGFQRFCSNYLATSKEGFSRDIFFTNEESPDYVFRQQASWPPPIGDPAEREAGLVIALDVQTGQYHPIYGMGRHNHENNVAIPGYEDLVVLSGDDTFTSGPLTGVTFPAGVSVPSQSQLYSYIAPSTDSLLADEGDLWAFVSDTPGVKNYYDVIPGSGTTVTGHFIQVPKDIATGLDADGSELKAADKGFPLPPTNATWQTDLRSVTPVGIDGPQWVLEYWSDINNVFQFVRVEDIAYDKRPGMGNVVYISRLGPRPARRPEPGHAELQVHERPRLEDGARSERPDDRDVAHRVRRGRRQRREDARRDPPAGQHRDDGDRTARDRGSRQQPAVRPRRPGAPQRDDGASVVRPVLGHALGGGEARSVRRRRGDRRRWAHRRQLGRVGIDRDRGRLGGLRARHVPDQHPGTYALGREGGR